MKIIFVCLGNICRSPLAEFVMRDLLAGGPAGGPGESPDKNGPGEPPDKTGPGPSPIKNGPGLRGWEISSAGTSNWHEGEGMHPRSAAQLRTHHPGLDFSGFASRPLSQKLCDTNELIIAMDEANVREIEKRFASTRGRVFKLLAFAGANLVGGTEGSAEGSEGRAQGRAANPAAGPAEGPAEWPAWLGFLPGGDVPDPWHTGDFDEAYRLILAGCEGLARVLGGGEKWGVNPKFGNLPCRKKCDENKAQPTHKRSFKNEKVRVKPN